MQKYLLLLVVIHTLYSNYSYSQTGSIIGKVVDASTGENIIGANITVDKTTFGVASDIDGNYTIKNIPAGKVDLIVSFISYTKIIIKDIIIEAGKSKTINISLKSEAIDIGGEVLVVGEVSNQYEAALLNQRRKSNQISDGISAEQIKRSTDNTTAETLRRVPGLTLLDNKFIFVRGVSERYNGALLNNSPLASSEPDKKDFAFDLIPASLIENTIVIKSFTPDEPGDFAGGLVKVNTVEFPSSTIFSFNYSSSYVDKVTSKNLSSYQGSPTDYLGLDNGFRDLPEGFPDPLTYKGFEANTDTNKTFWSKKLNDKWGTTNMKAFLDQTFGITYGEKFDLFGNDFGLIAALSYKTGFNRRNIISRYIENKINEQPFYFDYSGENTSENVYWGGILNLSYKISDFDKISIKNTFTVNSDDEITLLHGYKFDYGQERKTTAYHFISRNLYSGQLTGSHYLPILGGTQIDWRGSYSSSFRDEPDYRRAAYTRSIGSDSSTPFLAYIPQDPDYYGGGRFYSYLEEYKRGIGIELSHSIDMVKIKYGINHYTSSRFFKARLLSVTSPYPSIVNIIGNYSLDSVFSSENFGKRLIFMREYYDPQNDYNSSDNLFSYFFMTEVPLHFLDQDFNFVTGLRVENYIIRLNTTSSIGTGQKPIRVNRINSDILPAFTLIYKVSENTNFRFSFSRTINRPQFREIAPFIYYNFEDQSFVQGNLNLKQAKISNYDLRYETFPDIGELISISVFYKYLKNPIERIFNSSTSQNDRTFANAPDAKNFGFELEYRTSLSKLTFLLNNFNLTANYTRIWSVIKEKSADLERERPMQGQSPYVINITMGYTDSDHQITTNLAYNRFGKRIVETSNILNQGVGDDRYESPRDIIDFVFTKGVGEHFEVKLTIKDLLAQPYKYIEDKILVKKYTTNAKLSLGVSYKL